MASFMRRNAIQFAAVSTAAATMAATIPLFLGVYNNRVSELGNAQRETISAIISAQEIDSLKGQINQISESIRNASDATEGDGVSFKLIDLESRIENISNQLGIIKTIENAIVDSPERAMSIPILRKDMDSLQKGIADDVASLRTEIERIYDLGKWFLGLIASMTISILLLAVAEFRKNKTSSTTQVP